MKGKSNLLLLAVSGVLSANVWASGFDEPAGAAINMLSTLQDSSAVNYINAAYLADANSEPPTLSQVKTQVLTENRRYLIDFSNIEHESDKHIAQDKLRQSLGLLTLGDMIIISEHKGKLLFSQLEGPDDSNLERLEYKSKPRRVKKSVSPLAEIDNSIPRVAFYIEAKRTISDAACNPTWNTYQGPVKSTGMCDNAHISLIYQVTLQRSLPYGSQGSATPDAKIVRVAIDDSTTGAGIKLNRDFGKILLHTRGIPWPEGGDEHEMVTTALAQNYDFNFNASNDKARILRTVPKNNLNKNYTNREISTFSFGVVAGGEASSDGAKGKLEASANWTESKWLSFETNDYRVDRHSNGSQHVGFEWAREQYPTAESVMVTTIHGYTAGITLPVDESRIHKMGHASFLPKMEVIYSAAPDATGKTKFDIDSSVDITGFRYMTNVTPFFGVRTYYAKDSDHQVNRVNKNISFVVDWDHPVFTGGRPVNLQLGGFKNRCIAIDNQQRLSSEECDEYDNHQAFIYSRDGQYISAYNTEYCLDSDDLSQARSCSLSLTQKWSWEEETKPDNLKSAHLDRYLTHDKQTGELSMSSGTQTGSKLSTKMYTRYVNVFDASTIETSSFK
ncbi:leukocidin family pore-forming toxin [Vibrio sp. VPAP30]|uniref:leukocidin family pore-forming toxin n=1 Tax=Vibrio sp. VPAP30 TaxID=1647102 RepID=UPI000659D4E9|nr:leukocidin family pore-forming toxin [Vibrio sp. VPAP30]KLN63278.1 cytolysin and hemolysin HlyA Pore-forming toxin [Vibrio sp. VPAP30]